MKFINNIKENKSLYEDFKKYCIKIHFNQDRSKFKKFENASDSVVINYLIKYLENVHKIDISDALFYYSYNIPSKSFDYKLKKAIYNEIKRIEKRKPKPSYLPF